VVSALAPPIPYPKQQLGNPKRVFWESPKTYLVLFPTASYASQVGMERRPAVCVVSPTSQRGSPVPFVPSRAREGGTKSTRATKQTKRNACKRQQDAPSKQYISPVIGVCQAIKRHPRSGVVFFYTKQLHHDTTTFTNRRRKRRRRRKRHGREEKKHQEILVGAIPKI
jgi:hypothetical protein